MADTTTLRNPQHQYNTHKTDAATDTMHFKDFKDFGAPQIQRGPTTQQIVALVTLVPIAGVLLGLSGLTFVGTLIGLAIAAPLFLLFSPVIVPAALTVALAVAGFLASGAFGITALSSLYWLANYVRRMRGPLHEQLEHTKWRVQDTPAPGQKRYLA